MALLWPLWVSAQTVGDGISVQERDEAGVLTSILTGEKARISPGKPVRIEKLVIRFFEPDGETVRMKMESPTCEYDDRRGRAISDDDVWINGDGFDIRGKGFVYTAREQRMDIKSQVRVKLTNASARKDLTPETPSAPKPAP